MSALRAELLKVVTTRLLLWYGVGLVAFLVLVLSVHMGSDDRVDLSRLSTQRSIFAIAGLAAVVSVLVGTVLVTAEYVHGTINQSFLAQPRRDRVLAAKLVAVLVLAAGLGIAADVVTMVLAELWYHGRGVTLELGSRTLAPLLGVIGACMLAGAVGVGIGALLRRQTGAIVAILLWLLIGEAVIGGVGRGARFAPGHAIGAVIAAHGQGATDRLGVWAAVATGCLYAAVLCALGFFVAIGSDVPSRGD